MSAALDQISAEALAADLRNDYLEVRVLPDGSVAALLDLVYTRALHLGCTQWGYARRFCFPDRGLATRRFADLQTEDDEPAGYIAKRGS